MCLHVCTSAACGDGLCCVGWHVGFWVSKLEGLFPKAWSLSLVMLFLREGSVTHVVFLDLGVLMGTNKREDAVK